MRLLRHTLLLVACLGLAVFAAACLSSKSADPAGSRASSAEKQARRSADSALVRAGTPGAVVLEQWHFLKVGAVPPAILAYSPKVRQAVRVAVLAGAAASLRENLSGYKPVVVKREHTKAGELLRVKAFNGASPVVRYTYLFRRERGEWTITYDTLMQSALESQVKEAAVPGAKQAIGRFGAAELDTTAASDDVPARRR